MAHRIALALGMLAFAAAAPAAAADWPHWMGPMRNNVWSETGILEKFPPSGPKIIWRAPITGGFAGPAVAQGKVFATGFATPKVLEDGNFARKSSDGQESVMAYDAATGKLLWKQSYPVRYTISYPTGPRCTPTVDGDRVYFLGAEGNLLCCNVESGKILWKKDLRQEYKTRAALWGYAAHPLVDGEKLITLAGGDGTHVIALEKKTGREIWHSQSQSEQGYVPPSIIKTGETRQLIIGGPTALRALDPETGKRLWTTPYDASNGAIIMTPIRVKDYLFVGGFDNKNLLIKMPTGKTSKVEVIFKDKKKHGLSPVNVQPFAVDGVIYGFDGDGLLYAVEIPSGKRLWESDKPLKEDKKFGSGSAFIVKNGNRFILFNELGEIIFCRLSPKGYEEIDRAKVIAPTSNAFGRKVVWCPPAYAGKKMYVRNDKEILCVDLSK